jgi:hypothetical protein
LQYLSNALSKLNLVELRPKEASYSLLAQAHRKRRNSVYCDANADISHVAPRGTESDANYLATSFPHGRARRHKQGHTKGVFFLLDEHKKNPYPTFYERQGDKRREKNRCSHAGAPHQHSISSRASGIP